MGTSFGEQCPLVHKTRKLEIVQRKERSLDLARDDNRDARRSDRSLRVGRDDKESDSRDEKGHQEKKESGNYEMISCLRP